MDTGSIIQLIITTLFGGGLVTFVTLRDKKTEAMLSNMEKVIEELRGLAGGYKTEVAELKSELREKEAYIDDLHRKASVLYEKLDKANSRAAIFKILKCQEISCPNRKPPIGTYSAETEKQINAGTIGEETE